MCSVGGKGFDFVLNRPLIGKELLVRTNLVLAEQRYLFGEFVHLHQIVFEKIVKPRRILLFLIVLRKVAELIAVV